jgi:DNA invertase Pin-like site-specific DNA recombinase
MRVATYLRVSTNSQDVDAQRVRLMDYAKARAFQVVHEFADNGQSGAKTRRPALDALLASCRRREVDAVLISRLDRLGRSVRHLCEVAAVLDDLGVALIVADQGLDSSTSAGRFVYHTLAAVCELERELLRERTLQGLEAARRRGKTLGRPRALGRTDRERVARLRRSGTSIRAIAKQLEVSATTIQREVTALSR